MGISLAQLLIILLIILLLFGAGKLPQVMGQLGKGVKAFKDSMKDDNQHQDDIPNYIQNNKQQDAFSSLQAESEKTKNNDKKIESINRKKPRE